MGSKFFLLLLPQKLNDMRNILIADSGSTTADWAQVDGIHADKIVKTAGINPYFYSEKEIVDIFQLDLLPFINHELVEEIFFYGAGLMSMNNVAVIDSALLQIFGRMSMTIETDILGAARSLFGDNPGIACILGTGSNSCIFDGKKITDNIRSVGFILGDEGSGAHMGIALLKAYVREELPSEIKDAFEATFRYRKDEILGEIYRKSRPNRFIASFAKFIEENQNNTFISEMIANSFALFFDNNVCKYPNYKEIPVGFTGSIGYHFQEILKETANRKGITITKITETPIQGLIDYHFKRD